MTHDVRNLKSFWMGPGCLSIAPPEYKQVAEDIRRSAGVIMIVPIYCYTASSVAKCLTEVFNEHLAFKPMAFIVSAGTDKSYLALRDLIASVTFEQNTICYPKIHFETSNATTELTLENKTRCAQLITNFAEFSLALAPFIERKSHANN